MRAHQGVERRRLDERDVAREDEHVAPGEVLDGLLDGVAGPELLALEREGDGDAIADRLSYGGLDLGRLVADDHDDPVRRELEGRADDVGDEGAAAKRVEHLGATASNAGPEPGGLYDDV
jgi:hypothetical protein